MATLYVTSQGRAGKTMLCAGIGRRLLADGKKVGYLRTVTTGAAAADPDALFMKQALRLTEPAEDISPMAEKAWEACAAVASGKDVVIVEGPWDRGLAEALGARVIAVVPYAGDVAEKAAAARDFGGSLVGVVINTVPQSRIERVAAELPTRLAAAGVKLLGVIPEERMLLGLAVSEIAGIVGGEILNNTERSADLVEGLMLGAMVVGSGLEYFARKSNKAAIIRGERADMQLAALETSTRCLVLTGDTAPIGQVMNRAKEKNIPVIRAKGDTAAVATALEEALAGGKFGQEKKMPRLAQLLERHFNFDAFQAATGLAA